MSNVSHICPVCSIDKTLLTKMKVARTFDKIIIKALEDKVARLEARGIEDMQSRIDELEAAIAQHKRESKEMKDYTRFPAYSFENTKLWQVIE
jgi:hypothetical protein